MATGDGPGKSLVALGYASWGPGQLEDEILANSWLSVPADADIVFDMPFDQRWRAAAKSLGVDITQIAPDAGHA
jgi:putative transcriptional regulator